MSDTLEIFGQEYTNVTGFKATDSNDNVLSYSRSQSAPTLQTKTVTYTPSTTAVTDTVVADSGYDGLDEVDVTVSAVPAAEYVGQATVPNGTHEITVRNDGTIASYYEGGGNVPVIVQSGYASSSDEVFVYANSSEITQMQTQAAQTVTPSTATQTVGAAGRYMTGAVTVNPIPSNYIIPSGSETKTANGTYDVTNLAELIVNVASVKTATGTFTGNGTRQADISCSFEPDLVYWTSNPGTTSSSGTVAGIIARGMMSANRYRNNSTTNSHYAVIDITDMNTGGSSYSFRATYSNSTVTLYCFSNNARSLFTNGRTYTYTFLKWTT